MSVTPHRLGAALVSVALISASAGAAEATEPRLGNWASTAVVTQTDEAEADEAETDDGPGAPPLARGDRDQLVEWWQDRVNEWLRLSGSETYPIVVDGWFGPQTEQATIEFQESVDELDASGIVNPVDRVALRDAIEELEADPGAPPLARGDRDQLVEWWQDRLNEWLRLSGSDTYPIVVDGWFGPQTEQATIEFQESVDELDATGIVNPVDRVALRDAIEELEAAPGAPPLARGDRDQLVEWWQDRVNEWLRLSGSETYPIVVDGWFGPQTEQATIEFQESVDELDASGIVNPVDRVALRDAIEELERDGVDEPPVGDEPIGMMSTDTVSEPGDVDGTALLESVETEVFDEFERIVFHFAEGEDVGYQVGYTDTVPTDIAGEPVEVDGAAMLEVSLPQTTGVDLTGAEPEEIYTGPDRFTVDDLDVVEEIAIVTDQHGAMSWVIGTTGEVPFAVGHLDEPFRIVIDISTTS
jgi:peptidoglycan hydrolase-like protein with peptidoglycan-binding domain